MRESSTASGSAHAPVPGSSVSAGIPSATSNSHASIRSPTDSEFASPVVPKIASPWQPASSSPPAVRGERLPVDREVVAHRRERRGEDALHTTSPCRTVFSVTTRGSTNCSR